MGNAARKLNRAKDLPYFTVYYAGTRKLRLPTMRKKGLRGEQERGLTGAEIFMLSQIAALSSPEEDGRQCTFSYKEIENTQGMGSGTVNRTIDNLCAGGFLEQDKSDYSQTRYRVKVKLNKSKYIYIDTEMVRKRGITVNGEFYHLSRHAILVYSLILTHCLNEANGGKFRSAHNKIANTLGISSSSAGKCVRKLLKIKAIKCTVTGVNSGVESEYEVVPELLSDEAQKRAVWAEERAERKARREKRKPAFRKEIEARNEQAARESTYAKRRSKAANKANFYKMKLTRDTEYQRIAAELTKTMRELAEAEVFHPELVAELTQKYEELEKQLDARMSKLAITREMTEAETYCQCQKCSDTGFLSDGTLCDCYKPPRGKP